MGLGKQAKTLSKGQVGCRAGLPCQDPLARQESAHLPIIGQSRPEGQGEIARLTWRMVTEAR